MPHKVSFTERMNEWLTGLGLFSASVEWSFGVGARNYVIVVDLNNL